MLRIYEMITGGIVTVLLALSLGGCSLILDADNLQAADTGDPADSEPEKPCTSDEECADKVDCTEDICGTDGKCLRLPDNNVCGTLEVCDAQDGCVPSGDDCSNDDGCDDGIDCTVDRCVTGTCQFAPDHTFCADPSLLCIEGARCDVTSGCVAGTEIPCDQPAGICIDAKCNPENGQCEAGPMAGADDDADLSYDAACGGDDCDDSNDAIQPGATEVCNEKDDNCDGHVDVALSSIVVDVVTDTDLSNPSLAFNGQVMGVLWQQGTGSARDLWIQFFEQDGTPVKDPIRLNLSGVAGTAGIGASLTAVGETFYAAWSTTPSSGPLALQVAEIEAVDGVVTVNTPTQIALAAGVDKVVSPVIKADLWRTTPTWVLAWGTRTDANSEVYLFAADMIAPISLESRVGVIGSAALAPLSAVGGRDYAVAWELDGQIRESRVTYTSDWTVAAGFPADVSGASYTSDSPTITDNGSAERILAWREKNTQILTTAISAHNGTGISYLVNPSTRPPSPATLLFGEQTFSLLYLKDISASAGNRAIILQYEQFVAPLQIPDDRLAQTPLLVARDNADEDTWINTAFMGHIAPQTFVVAWIWKDSDGATTLQYGIAAACTP